MPDEDAQPVTEATSEARDVAEEGAGDGVGDGEEAVETEVSDTPEAEVASDGAEGDEPADVSPADSVEEPADEPVADSEADVESEADEPVDETANGEGESSVDDDEPDAPPESAPSDGDEPTDEHEPTDEAAPEQEPDEDAAVEQTAAADAPIEPDVQDEEPAPEDTEDAAPDDSAPEEPLTGRARLADALFHLRRGQAAAAVLLCVLGFAAVLQVRTNDQDNSYTGQREQDLIDILSGLAGTTQKAQEQLETLNSTREQLRNQTSKQRAAVERAQEQVATLRVIAGTVPVTGPGITITVDPGSGELHLVNYLDLIEELRTQGAEAIEVNGKVRVVASTPIEVSKSVPGLVVEGKLIRPPFRIKVIGRPDALDGAVTFSRGPKDQLEDQGAKVRVARSEKIKIESVHKTDH